MGFEHNIIFLLNNILERTLRAFDLTEADSRCVGLGHRVSFEIVKPNHSAAILSHGDLLLSCVLIPVGQELANLHHPTMPHRLRFKKDILQRILQRPTSPI